MHCSWKDCIGDRTLYPIVNFIDMCNDFPEITSMIQFDSNVLYLFVDFVLHQVDSASIYDKRHTVDFVTKIRVFNAESPQWKESWG